MLRTRTTFSWISVFMLCYGTGLLFRGLPCISANFKVC
jgi:hypothetical protein